MTGQTRAGRFGACMVTAVLLAVLAGAVAAVGQPPPAPERAEERRFWVNDTHHYRSPWYRGSHRRMINFGCTRAPYYPPDPRCAGDRGVHHGVDIAMGCGTVLTSAVRGRVVRPRSAGALGPAYGAHAFRIRIQRGEVDIVLGHVGRVFVRPGDRVRPGSRIARASDLGAPDGCHLHFEVRPAGGGYTSARDPERLLQATRTD